MKWGDLGRFCVDQAQELLKSCQVRMICNKHEVADRLVTREGLGIRTIFLIGILESRDDKGKVPPHKSFHKCASFHVVQSEQVSLEVVSDERPKIGTGKEIDIQHHHKARSRV